MNQERCTVCEEPLAADRAACHRCGREFHLALRSDSAVVDCGDAWIDGELEALVFSCNTCLGRVPAVPRRRRTRHVGVTAAAVARSRKRTHDQSR